MQSKFIKPQEQNPLIKYLPGKTDRNNPGKWLPVWMHLEDTAGIMKKLVLKWLSPNITSFIDSQIKTGDVISISELIAYLHDIGKFTPAFAGRILESLPFIRQQLDSLNFDIPGSSFFLSNTPHALAGQCILHERNFPACLSIIVGAHHGAPQETYEPVGDDDMVKKPENYYGRNGEAEPYKTIWHNVWNQWIDYSLFKCGFESADDLPVFNQSAQMLLTGLLIMADWIASNPYYFPLISVESCGSISDYPSRIEYAWEKFDKTQIDIWTPGLFYASPDDFSERFTDSKGFTIKANDVQTAIMDVLNQSSGRGIYILEAPMGSGKTEAALFAAEVLAAKTGVSGIFCGLPTQATANGIFNRLLPWAEKQSMEAVHSIRLAHGMAELNDDYRELFEGESAISNDEDRNLIVHEWFKGRKQALLSDFVIGTVDQLLLAGLSRKHVMLRHLGLAGKVVILDECHAYDAYMNRYMDRVLRWLGSYGVPVIILSATLPAKRRIELVTAYVGKKNLKTVDDHWKTCHGYPLLTWTDEEIPYSLEIPFTGHQTPVGIDKIYDEEVIGRLSDVLSDGGCAGVIVNTVKRAQEFAENIERSIPDVKVLLFHSQFIAPDRAEHEKDLLNRIGKNSTSEQRNRLVIVGTQVLEQSLDIDFDYLITDLCPMDLLLQRIGRLHRHERTRPEKLKQAHCSVLRVCDEDFLKQSVLIYGRWMLMQTKNLLPDHITLPGDIPKLVQEAYKDSETHEDDWNTLQMNIIKQQGKAEQFCIPEPSANEKKTIKGLLNTFYPGNTQAAEASVRDGLRSITVLVMKRYADDSIGFLPWVEGGAKVPRDHKPSQEEARKIAGQKINLPYVFNLGSNASKVIEELETINKNVIPEWQQVGFLKGELILLLDENNQTDLCGFHLFYDREKGLIVTNGKEEDERNERN